MFIAIYSTESSGDLRREFDTYDAACGFVDSQGSGCVLDTADLYPIARYATHQWYSDCY